MAVQETRTPPETRHETRRTQASRFVFGRSLSRQSWAGRLRRDPRVWRASPGTLWRFSQNDKQSDGTDGGNQGARGPEGALRRAARQRFRVFVERNREAMGVWLAL